MLARSISTPYTEYNAASTCPMFFHPATSEKLLPDIIHELAFARGKSFLAPKLHLTRFYLFELEFSPIPFFDKPSFRSIFFKPILNRSNIAIEQNPVFGFCPYRLLHSFLCTHIRCHALCLCFSAMPSIDTTSIVSLVPTALLSSVENCLKSVYSALSM